MNTRSIEKRIADVWHWQYIHRTHVEGWGVATQPCEVYHRNRWKGHHRATTRVEKVSCERCHRIPEFLEALRREGLAELNNVIL